MQMLTRDGAFRGHVLEWAVSKSIGGYPQFVMRLAAEEWYNPETNEYEPWNQYEQEIRAYLILFAAEKDGSPKEMFHVDDIKSALDWDGLSFESLENGEWGDKVVMFRTSVSDFNGKIQVQSIGHKDAPPITELKRVDTSVLADMTAKYAGMFKANTSAPKPAAAPKKTRAKKASPPPTDARAVPTAPPPPAPTNTVPGSVTTKDAAWAAVCDAPGDMTPDDRAALWAVERDKIGSDESKFSAVNWEMLARVVVTAITVTGDGIPY